MKIDIDQRANVLNISAYSKGGITIGGRLLAEPFVVFGSDILFGLIPPSITAIGSEHIEKLVKLEQSIILIGTGETQRFLDARILHPALENGIGIEVMNSAAACRSYNVLAGEDRAVVGAFYMP
jgi:uncharacterized protein